jgi:hypothetical protein
MLLNGFGQGQYTGSIVDGRIGKRRVGNGNGNPLGFSFDLFIVAQNDFQGHNRN